MSPAPNLLRAVLAMLVMLGVAIVPALAPAQACTAMVPAAMAAMDHDKAAAPKPMLALRCDTACVACLVQPTPVQFAIRSFWSAASDYGAETARLDDIAIKPDLPPPRIWLA